MGFQPPGKDARHRDCGVETYERGHCTNQIDDGVQPILADNFLVADFLADGEVPQSKKLNVGVVRVIALRFSLSAKKHLFREHPSKLATCEKFASSLIACWGGGV